ncbi:hypothetical protein U9M48_026654 [Paspalum notatum var. saurae]|uniref:Reverse transcriptase domain-containing protein n=1 Tax=Paspalum notatum var. saurae TaxID=547442 RepID=A0AAQ3WZ75_PASNO
MCKFRRCVAELELQDVHLHGRAFTWSNERQNPTLVRLDRVLATLPWEERFPNAFLQALSSDASDHTPLLLQTNVCFTRKPRFHFECFWPSLDGFGDALVRGWHDLEHAVGPYHRLDTKLRNLIKELQGWSASKVGMIRDQLAVAREVILKPDQALEVRAPTTCEAEFRSTLKKRCLGLSSPVGTMARQRAECVTLPRVMRTLVARGRKKKIFIPRLLGDSLIASSFEDMEQLLYNHFKGILASSPVRGSALNLRNVGFTPADLSSIDGPFTEEEVWEAIRDMPRDRAPGPDGFTGAFYKAAWSIIKLDVLAALQEFYVGNGMEFDKLNNGLIILLPKVPGAERPSDFRPIALVHSFGKLVSKLLARRLAPLLPRLVSCNQTAFVRVHCERVSASRAGRILLKIDISKAFDTLAWSFLPEVLEACGFGARWRNWVSILLSSASSRVLPNGQPGRNILHRRGVRQGDSLSPMLFILAVDALNRLFDKAVRRGVLSGTAIPNVKFFCSLYADDIVLFFKATIEEAVVVKWILQAFGDASGLQINLAKCSITPIRVDEDTTTAIAAILGCQVADFPIRYLGLPLCTGPLPRVEVHKVVEAVQRKLPACHGPLMARSGRLVWIKSVLMAMPIFVMMGNGLPGWAKEEIDAMCRRFLWAGGDQQVKGKCLVSWPVIVRPKQFGGLGVLDLKLFSIALQSRWLWLQRTDEDRVWAGLPISVASDVRQFFDASIQVKIGNGRKTLFWLDKWLDGQSVQTMAPALVSAVSRRDLKNLSVADGLNGSSWIRSITGGLTITVIEEYLALWARLSHVVLRESVEDRVVWRWTTDGQYSARSAYLALNHGSQEFPGYELIWNSWMPLRVKIFLWLAFRRRLWTADRRRRHGLDARDTCFLCDSEQESIDHILVSCSFVRSIWVVALARCGVSAPPASDATLLSWWQNVRAAWPTTTRHASGTVVGLVSWCIWKERNKRCFENVKSTLAEVLLSIRALGELWCSGGASMLGELGLV